MNSWLKNFQDIFKIHIDKHADSVILWQIHSTMVPACVCSVATRFRIKSAKRTYCVLSKAGFPLGEFFRGEKVEAVRTHFFEEKRAAENCGACKLRMSVLEIIRFARKIRLVENRL